MNRLRIAVAVVVTVVWAVVYVGSVFSPKTITAPPELSGVMLAVVTWLFTSEALKKYSITRKANGGGNDTP